MEVHVQDKFVLVFLFVSVVVYCFLLWIGCGARTRSTRYPKTCKKGLVIVFIFRPLSPTDSATIYDASEQAKRREAKFQALLEASNVDLQELRRTAWKGIPSTYRAISWQILMGYLPTSKDRRTGTLARKQQEYNEIVKQHYLSDLGNDPIYRQVHISHA